MSLEHTQKVYKNIFEELMKTIREDPLLQSQLDKSAFDLIESLWSENLEQSGIFNNAYKQDLGMITDKGNFYGSGKIPHGMNPYSFQLSAGNLVENRKLTLRESVTIKTISAETTQVCLTKVVGFLIPALGLVV